MKTVCSLVIAVLAAGCVTREKPTLQSLDPPVNCATAEGDVRALQNEKAHVAAQVAQGLTAITPAGIVLGTVPGTETTKLQVGAGDYNGKIDARIAAIKTTCGIR